MSKEEKELKDETKSEKPDHKLVTITVDGDPKKIERGNYGLAEFKVLIGVDENMDLDELIDGKFEAVSETKKIHIKGDEIFVSHVKTGESS